MIGVLAREAQRPVVEEFFELFKTPWSHWREGMDYDVVVATDHRAPSVRAKLLLVFSPDMGPMDDRQGTRRLGRRESGRVVRDGSLIPIYGPLGTFEGPARPVLVTEAGQTAGFALEHSGQTVVRVGYDLFDEVEHLLRRGQPARQSLIPTLDIHISMLRDWTLAAGLPLAEIPPAPYGYDFITCLTHDIDFMGIRDHRFDHTMLGFISRALSPSYARALDRKTSRSRYWQNIRALTSLPLVHMGLRPDFWYPLDKYQTVESGLKSTFFFIPFKDRPGESLNGKPAAYRASRYDVTRFRQPIQDLKSRGHEVALHGIDAWRDAQRGREELEVIRRISGENKIGVRMHWLYYSGATPAHLEDAGIYYDSTLGYNETVGFRSGTGQVFRAPGTRKLFELPLHVQDTAMFYPDRMNLPASDAVELCEELIRKMKTYGGAFTLNWHDRSLVPERNWGAPYLSILGRLKQEKTWFATAGQLVAWFEKRRACRFADAGTTNGVPSVTIADGAWNGPPLAVRSHRPGVPSRGESRFEDTPLAESPSSQYKLSDVS